MSRSTLFVLGAALAAVGVAAGAFGAHALASRVTPERLETFDTAVRYQLIHALGLLAVALLGDDSRQAAWAGILFIVGIALFSGSLYLLVLTGVRAFGAITPLGGVAFIAGWVLLAIAGGRALAR